MTCKYVQSYISQQVWIEGNHSPRIAARCQIYWTAMFLSSELADTEPRSVRERVNTLCGKLSQGEPCIDRSPLPSPLMRDISQLCAVQERTFLLEDVDGPLGCDLLAGAAWLGHHDVLHRILSKGCFPGYPNIFDSLEDIGYMKDDIELVKLSRWTEGAHQNMKPLIRHSICGRVLRKASMHGSMKIFDLAVGDKCHCTEAFHDHFATLFSGEIARAKLIPPGNVALPEHYDRLTTTFGIHYEAKQLHQALVTHAERGNKAMVHHLLGQGARLNLELTTKAMLPPEDRWIPRPRQRFYAPLLRAVEKGHTQVVELLLQGGADPNLDSTEDTPLMSAARNSAFAIAELLLEYGARPKRGRPPPIVWAIYNEHCSMIQLLLTYGAVLDTPETGGWAMSVAQVYGLDSMIMLLREAGVPPDGALHRCPELDEVAENGEWSEYTHAYPHSHRDIFSGPRRGC